MVMLAATALEGGGTPSDTPDQQYDTPPLPSGGGIRQTLWGSSTVVRRPPTFVVGGTRDEGGGSDMAGGLSIVSGR